MRSPTYLTATFLLLSLPFTIAFPTTDTAATLLLPRACTSNGCACWVGTPQGQYCGNTEDIFKGGRYVVKKLGTGGRRGDIFECAPSGKCCRYGPRDYCENP